MEIGKTPMELQYDELKKQYNDCILLYRMGDFYEGFDDDAKIMSEVLKIALTSRSRGEVKRPMAGVPWHAIDDYLYKLVSSGHKVAIAEQLEDAKKAKGLVKRGVTRIVTPGTVDDLDSLPADKNNYILCLAIDKNEIGLSYIDLLDGVIKVIKYKKDDVGIKEIIEKIKSIGANEIIICNYGDDDSEILFNNIYKLDIRCEINNNASKEIIDNIVKNLLKHLGVHSLKGFGLNSLDDVMAISVSYLYNYISLNQKSELEQINKIALENYADYTSLDFSTINGLDIFENSSNGRVEESLFGVLNHCSTAMGQRLLRERMLFPFKNENFLKEQLDTVNQFYNNQEVTNQLRSELKNIRDLRRLSGKIGNRNINPKEIVVIKNSLKSIEQIFGNTKDSPLLRQRIDNTTITQCVNLHDEIEKNILEEPSYFVNQGNIFRDDYSNEIKELRDLKRNSKQILDDMQKREIENSGITNLKIKYNKVFGYFIEISNSNLSKVPNHFIKKQTLVNCERYITEELKIIEEKILNADEELSQLETNLYQEYIDSLQKFIPYLQVYSDYIALVDLVTNFAYVALANGYTYPNISKDQTNIVESRHPVVEKLNTLRTEFIPNTYKSKMNDNFMLITGPNMSGKSTYIRQIALIQIMFQIGSFVPAREAKIKLVDRIFTRIGASDNLARGESTFMVEMNDVANILNNATKDSLIILDEVGRGTSTYDGVAIAWAVAEYVALNLSCSTLFATHYHELIRMEDVYENITNYKICVEEINSEVYFLYKIEKGPIDKSYGVHVAKLAGVPMAVIEKANEILNDLENKGLFEINRNTNKYKVRRRNMQKIRSDKQAKLL